MGFLTDITLIKLQDNASRYRSSTPFDDPELKAALESIIDAVLHPEIRDRMIMFRGANSAPPLLAAADLVRDRSLRSRGLSPRLQVGSEGSWRRNPQPRELGNLGMLFRSPASHSAHTLRVPRKNGLDVTCEPNAYGYGG